MSTAATTNVARPEIAWSRLWWVALLTIAASAIANAIIYWLGSAIGTIPQSFLFPPVNQPLMLWQVLFASVVGTLGGVLAFIPIGLWTRQPYRVYTIVAAVVLLLSFAMPFAVPGMPAVMIISLNLMHVVAAVITVWALTRFTRKP